MKFSYAEEGPTADLTMDAWGETLGEAFENAALAMFNAMTPIEGIEKRETRRFNVEGGDLGGLLFNFLDELLYLHEVELIVFSGFEVDLDEGEIKLTAVCHGEPFDLDRHSQGIAIKAVTFHNMRIEEKGDTWTIRVVLDT
jgi:SHS2 domain-containing protein